MRLLPFAVATALAGSLLAADPGLVSLAIPDSQLMAGVNVEQVMLSPLGQYLLTQAVPASEAGVQLLIEKAGFDPRRDLREILMSSTGLTGGNSGIVLARGTFDVPKILATSVSDGSTLETYKGVSIIQSKHDAMAFPDSTLAITGDAANVRAAIDRISAPTSIGSALAVQVNQLSTTEDAWFVSTAPLSQLQPQAAGTTGTPPVPFAMLSKVQQVSGGVKLGANMMVNLQAVSPTGQDALTLAAVLKSLASAADLFTPGDHYVPAAALLKSLNVTTDGPVTQISLSVPEQQIEAMIQAAHTNKHESIGVDPGALVRPPGRTPEAPPSIGAMPAPQRIRVGSAVQKAKLLQHPEPIYPPLALQARISGVVRLNATIGKDGTVQNLTLVSGHPLLVAPAMEAVKQWVYQPTVLNGQAVLVLTQIEVNFSLER